MPTSEDCECFLTEHCAPGGVIVRVYEGDCEVYSLVGHISHRSAAGWPVFSAVVMALVTAHRWSSSAAGPDAVSVGLPAVRVTSPPVGHADRVHAALIGPGRVFHAPLFGACSRDGYAALSGVGKIPVVTVSGERSFWLRR